MERVYSSPSPAEAHLDQRQAYVSQQLAILRKAVTLTPADRDILRDALTQVRAFGIVTIIANQLHRQLGDLADYALTAISNRIPEDFPDPDAFNPDRYNKPEQADIVNRFRTQADRSPVVQGGPPASATGPRQGGAPTAGPLRPGRARGLRAAAAAQPAGRLGRRRLRRDDQPRER